MIRLFWWLLWILVVLFFSALPGTPSFFPEWLQAIVWTCGITTAMVSGVFALFLRSKESEISNLNTTINRLNRSEDAKSSNLERCLKESEAEKEKLSQELVDTEKQLEKAQRPLRVSIKNSLSYTESYGPNPICGTCNAAKGDLIPLNFMGNCMLLGKPRSKYMCNSCGKPTYGPPTPEKQEAEDN